MSVRPVFDSAAYEATLRDGGVQPQQARAHREALTLVINESTSNLVTNERMAILEANLLRAIADQTTAMTRLVGDSRVETMKLIGDQNKLIGDQATRFLIWTITAVTAIVGLATALIKFTPSI